MPDAGILDLLAPLLSAIDTPLSVWFSPLVRLILWVLVAVGLPWLLYRLLTPVARLRLWQQELLFQRQMRGTFKTMGAKLPGNRRKILRLVFLLGLFRVPITLLCVGLFLMVSTWIPKQFAFMPPWPGEWIVLRPVPASFNTSQVTWRPAQRAAWSGDLQAWVVQWPSAGQTVRFTNGAGGRLFEVSEDSIGAEIVARHWWHKLAANPAGYLAPGSGLQRVEIELEPMEYLPWGPPWLRQWWVIPILMWLLFGIWRLWHWARTAKILPVV